MQYDFQRGFYTPSFFSITINAFLGFDKINELPIEVQSTFYHEYFHFIQDITTVFGLDCCWNSFDRIRQAIFHIQQSQHATELPLTGTIAEEIKKKKVVQDILMGSRNIDTPNDPNSYVIQNISLSRRDELTELFPNNDSPLFLDLHLTSPDGPPQQYRFGALAIMESMTFLIQSKHYPNTNANNYPYKSATKLIDFYSAKLRGNNEMIFALCDVSLLYTYPSIAFYDILRKIEQTPEFNPQSAADIYQFGINFLDQLGLNVWEELEKRKDGAIKMIEQIFGHPVFENDKKWLCEIINAAFNLRLKFPYLMVDLYNDETPLSNSFKSVLATLGTPDIINADGERWISAPTNLKDIEDKIQPVFLSALFQLHELLLKGAKKCTLKAKCAASKQKMPIDDNCDNSPWLKINTEPICPFGGLLLSFGLNENKIVYP